MTLVTEKPNVTQIAQQCGLSKMTVSRVLRNHPHVSQATRDLVLDVAEKIGFKPSRHYHEKQIPASPNYYVLFQQECSVNDAYFSEIILTIQNELFQQGFGCSFGVIQNEYSDFLKLNELLRARDIRGVLVVGDISRVHAETLQVNFPNLVFIDYPGGPTINKPYNAVCMDNVYGGHLAMDHLLNLGRRRILLIGGKKGHYFTEDLLRAYRETLTEHQLEIDPNLITYGDFHVEGGYEAVARTLQAGVSFDAIFTNDEMACGALKMLNQSNLRVPGDVAVVGFDGLPISEMVNPALTTVIVDRKCMGQQAVKRLLELVHGNNKEDRYGKFSLFPRLLIRESCGAKK
jgi:DNA-binding LacI/PurR family transcriptional regulator